MAKLPALAALAFLLFAGCSSAPSHDEAGADPSQPRPTFTTVVGQSTGPVYTDTLHLLDRPSSTPNAPTGHKPLRLPVDPFAQQAASGYFDDSWDYTWDHDVNGLVGNLTLWVDVTGEVVNDPNPLSNQGDCFWSFAIVIGSFETGDFHGLDCITEPTTVQPGIRQLVVPFELAGVLVPAKTPVHWEMHTQDLSRSPGTEIAVLTASMDYDSHLSLVGLSLPVDPSLVLQKT
ncbi:MAG TPA: hypothetical protein VM327_03440 [Candidatus Thermoplasmatota archaeon]|nr:hypothetical protein [Candidatus Thermoplasmatota archaeon]